MRHPIVIWAFLLAAMAASQPAFGCTSPDQVLPTSRVVQVDASTGPMFGRITRYASEPQFLREKEVVLTFDDGPSPRITRSILATLDEFCVKATFFPVGRMALAHPQVVKAITQQGHTIGGHTWSHPNNLRKLGPQAIQSQIERGFAAVAAANGQPIAPFFRFPGLNDDGRALRYLQKREVATFSVDVVSDDSYISDADELVQTMMSRVKHHGRGILLFHDIKPVTAEALPRILEGLRTAGFSVVHLKSKFTFVPQEKHRSRMMKRLKESPKPTTKLSLAGFHGTVRAHTAAAVEEPPVTHLAPEKRKIELAKQRAKRVRRLVQSIDGRAWTSIIEHKPTQAKQSVKPLN